MRSTICLFFSLLFFFHLYGQENGKDGLYFSSHEVNQDLRTSLNISPNGPLSLEGGFRIEFDAKFRQGDGYYGNILKIFSGNDLNIDLVSHLIQDNSNFWLVVNDAIVFKYKWADIPNSGLYKWLKFKLEINQLDKSVMFSINGKQFKTTSDSIVNIKNYHIIFGKSDYDNHITTDVCPMSIKNILLFDSKNNLIRNWPLGKHTKTNKVFDLIKEKVAIAQNPKWLMDEHIFWRKEKTLKFNNLLGTATSQELNKIFFIDKNAIYIYSLSNNSIDTLLYKGAPYPCEANTFIYNKHKDELWSYSFDSPKISKFNFRTSSWSLNTPQCEETSFWHHNKLISPRDSSLITFGGYGHYSYKNTFKVLSKNKTAWKNKNKNESLPPRYLSAAGIINNDEFLIFGGFGSITGNQMVNSHNFYDLYSVSFEKLDVTKIWSIEKPEFAPYVPSNNLLIDKESNTFYTLVFDNTKFNSSLKLAQFKIDEYNLNIYSDPIPFKFVDTKSNSTLVLNSEKNKLTALTTFENEVNLSSISYPPLLAEEVFIDEPVNNIIINVLMGLGSIVLLFLSYFLWTKKRAQKVKSEKPLKITKENTSISKITKRQKRKYLAVYMFGGFQVYDKDGMDITASFTPKIKQLFILILLSGVENDKGITSKKLISLLWSDKAESSARNNLNVNLSKLRILIDQISNIELTNENTYWKLNIDHTIYCDYLYADNILRSNNDINLSQEDLNNFLETISPGVICPDIKEEWMESMNAEITNKIINKLEILSRKHNDHETLIKIAEINLKLDSLNEEAIILKCKTLYRMGRKGLSRKYYDEFCESYKEILDTEFHLKFKDLIH
ncbi:hypothetical protein JM658_09110 [Joostella atrarenae]|uniref:Uncharacterized protein n=1 Tax=Joostella atrarenae TaxID=679257 RepID=A0ABS9J3H6_9FLAO|nr:hypothetical protein [Joostella atrarenae]MCF8714982.1 hypothetical protein [Joostella atrarenae]